MGNCCPCLHQQPANSQSTQNLVPLAVSHDQNAPSTSGENVEMVALTSNHNQNSGGSLEMISKGEEEDFGTTSWKSAAEQTPISVEAAKDWIKATLLEEVNFAHSKFDSKFGDEKMPPENLHENFTKNMSKNRKQKIVCLDETRVVLEGLQSDYIHANYMDTPKRDKRFIATQAPKLDTITDFWNMIIQQEVDFIISIGVFIQGETDPNKCATYWPEDENEVLKFGSGKETIKVTKIESKSIDVPKNELDLSEEMPEIIERKLEIIWNKGKTKRTVTHYQWKDWKDNNVPDSVAAPFELFRLVYNSEKPIVVHCNTGVGRTGTFVAIASLQEHLRKNKEVGLMTTFLENLRKMRAHVVINGAQFIYIHHALLYYTLERHKARFSKILEENLTEEQQETHFDSKNKSIETFDELYQKWKEDYPKRIASNRRRWEAKSSKTSSK